MSVELKIKSKHLSAESQIIRFEERKLKAQMKWAKRNALEKERDQFEYTFNSLSNHRKFDVRNENRATYLARAFLAGKPYKMLEQTRKIEKEYHFKSVVLPRVKALVSKYGSHNIKQSAETLLTEWFAA